MFFVFIVVAAAFALVLAGVRFWRGRAIRRLRSAPPTSIGELEELETVRVEGRVTIEGTPMLRSPIEGRPCVAYYLGLEYFDDGDRRQVPMWFPLGEETVVTRFRVVGEDGHVIEIDADRFDLELHFVETGRVVDPPKEQVGPVLRRLGDARRVRNRPLAYVEVVIEPGAQVSLIGKVLRQSTGAKGAYRTSGRTAELGPLRPGEPIRLDLIAQPAGS